LLAWRCNYPMWLYLRWFDVCYPAGAPFVTIPQLTIPNSI
jgi:hypothetical protein